MDTFEMTCSTASVGGVVGCGIADGQWSTLLQTEPHPGGQVSGDAWTTRMVRTYGFHRGFATEKRTMGDTCGEYTMEMDALNRSG